MDRPTCKTCPYFDSYENGTDEGECRIGRPIIGEVDDKPFGVWPPTYEFEFCGEHPDFPAYIASLKVAEIKS